MKFTPPSTARPRSRTTRAPLGLTAGIVATLALPTAASPPQTLSGTPGSNSFGSFVLERGDHLAVMDLETQEYSLYEYSAGAGYVFQQTGWIQCFLGTELADIAMTTPVPGRDGWDLTTWTGFPLVEDEAGAVAGLSPYLCLIVDHTPSPGDRFGSQVEVDGLDRVVASSPGSGGGRVYTFANSALVDTLPGGSAGDGPAQAGDEFGSSLEIDGNWLFVGAEAGRYVRYYEMVGLTWIYRGTMTVPPGGTDLFGIAIDFDAASGRGFITGVDTDLQPNPLVAYEFEASPGGQMFELTGETIVAYDGLSVSGDLAIGVPQGPWITPACTNLLTEPRLFARDEFGWHIAASGTLCDLEFFGLHPTVITDESIVIASSRETLEYDGSCELLGPVMGLADVYEIASLDSAIQIALNPALDCNEDGILDSTQPLPPCDLCDQLWVGGHGDAFLNPAHWDTDTDPAGSLTIDSMNASILSADAGVVCRVDLLSGEFEIASGGSIEMDQSLSIADDATTIVSGALVVGASSTLDGQLRIESGGDATFEHDVIVEAESGRASLLVTGARLETEDFTNLAGDYVAIEVGVRLENALVELEGSGSVLSNGSGPSPAYMVIAGTTDLTRTSGGDCSANIFTNGASSVLHLEAGAMVLMDGHVVNNAMGVILLDAGSVLDVCNHTSVGGFVLGGGGIVIGPGNPAPATLNVRGELTLDAASAVDLPTGTIVVARSFDVQAPAEDLRLGTLQASEIGFLVTQEVEVFSPDLGTEFNPRTPPAGTLDRLELGPLPAKVHLVDTHDNGGTGGGADALYARTIHVSDGATLDLQGLTVYAETVTIEGTGTILGQVITVDLTPEPGDVTGDGIVNFDDLVAALAAWGPCPDDACNADLDGDGMVGLSDVLEVLANWPGA